MKYYMPGYVVPFGIDMYGGNSDADGQVHMQAAGSGWETIIFYWASVEPNAPVAGVHTYHSSSFDPVAARVQAAGMHAFVLFTANPTWTAQYGGGPVHPANVPDLNSVAAAAAERFDGDGFNDAPGSPIVNDWSFYAEPHNRWLVAAQNSGNGFWGDNPTGYGDMISIVATAMHAANPKTVVKIGGLAYDYFAPVGPYVQTFLAGVLDQLNTKSGGAAAYLDAVAFHYYPINTGRWPTIKEKTAEIRSILSAHGLGSLPLIVPEMGYWSETVPGTPSFDSNEPQQARTGANVRARLVRRDYTHVLVHGV